MDKLKQRFRDDPVFALAVLGVGAIIATQVLKATANTITAGTYAYNARRVIS